MTDVRKKLASSLTAETTELIPYLPYLLQDIYELGSSPTDMLDLLRQRTPASTAWNVLDLACGKGAVSVFLASSLGCHVKGIDLMPEFIAVAAAKAAAANVLDLCHFAVGDINEAIEAESDHDVVILGAAGDVLGTPVETIAKLRTTVKAGGFILIDDAYVEPHSALDYHTRGDWLTFFQQTHVVLLGEAASGPDVDQINRENQAWIVQRAAELTRAYPEKADLFAGYVQSQQRECDELAGDLCGITWLLQAVEAEAH